MVRRSPLARRVIAALLLVLLTACQTWQPTTVSLIPEEQPSSVRVTLRSGERATLENPTVRNDSIFGVTDAGLAGVATQDVRLLELHQSNVGGTILVIVLAAVAIPALIYISECTGPGWNFC